MAVLNNGIAFTGADFTVDSYQITRITVEEEELLDTAFFRFQNSSIPETYVYATGDEAENIRDNLTGFVEEVLAFNAAPSGAVYW
ncbi:MAG: hypothetical protein AB4372_27530 [Xenococcus sp. (in: cyanobacteria)]